ncbi:plant invertase/pectin methylesterase inhibitor [Striga asiatica]|uniref:Pectinesterase n=1 Tax=Striga asiatica TaxID=4170 RepID=A0A5A7RBY0_STRAF|nr:plant invertase/pectin methylesterase inhibitor [Striga asiatica]
MLGKIAVSVLSLLLVVGVVIGVVGVVKNHSQPEQHDMSGSMKMITSICESTNYKEACASSLESTAKNSSATPLDYISAIVGAPLGEVRKAIESLAKIDVNNATDPGDYVGLEDCKDLLDYAIDTLQASVSMVGDSDLHTIEDREHELLSWMSAVYSLQTTCRDQIDNPGYKSAVENGMLNATQLTHNAVNILADMSQLLTLFNVQPKRRRLLASDGYPKWFSAADRKLLARNSGAPRPNVVVAKDGSGQFKTIGQAVAAHPGAKHQGRFVIYVKAGIYNEQVIVDKSKVNLYMYGDGIDRTIVTGSKNYGKQGTKTMHTATFANEAPGFVARAMTFKNMAGPEGHQAVAFRSLGDKAAIFDCSFEGNQDTLYYQSYRQFYRNCRIYGTVDFIFGKGEAVIQDSEIIVRRPMPGQFNTVTADGREIRKGSNGLIIHNSRITADKYLHPIRFQVKTYLGRPWTEESLTVIMQSDLGDLIRPEGWKLWDGASNHKTCQVLEYANRGPGSLTRRRDRQFSHFKVLNTAEASRYTPGVFLAGGQWLPETGVPHNLNLY